MDNSLLQAKYRYLLEQLYSVEDMYKKRINDFESLERLLNESIKVNSNHYFEDETKNINKSTEELQSVLVDKIIPSVRSNT